MQAGRKSRGLPTPSFSRAGSGGLGRCHIEVLLAHQQASSTPPPAPSPMPLRPLGAFSEGTVLTGCSPEIALENGLQGQVSVLLPGFRFSQRVSYRS